MKIKFWGTRGSIPAPGPSTVRVGGNTTCIEVFTSAKKRIVIDAGTGIRSLGLELIKEENPLPMLLLLTHSHWDHLAGFTFFGPAYHPAHSISFYGHKMAQEVLQRDIFDTHDNRYFPVNWDNFRAKIDFHSDLPVPLDLNGVKIETLSLNHPGNGWAFKFINEGRSFALITDNEIGLKYEGGNTPEKLVNYCMGIDVLIHDAQYLPSEIEAHRGWGHSTYEEVIDIAGRAGVPTVYFTHHDPERDDDGCERMLEAAREYIASKELNIECYLAVEGGELEV